MMDNIIEINVQHPDFHKRLRSKLGKPIFDDRLIGYLASVVSSNFRIEAQKNRNAQAVQPSMTKEIAPEEFIGTFAEFEAALKRKLPALKRKIEGTE